jgi:hypothetical protein
MVCADFSVWKEAYLDLLEFFLGELEIGHIGFVIG